MKKIFASDTAFKIYSVLIALLLWVIVVYGQNPETVKVIKGIPIAYSNVEALEKEGLSVVRDGERTVDLRLRVKRLALARIDKRNIYAIVLFNETKRLGEYELGINIKLPIDNINIIDKSPYMLGVLVEKTVKAELPVEVVYAGTPKDESTMVRAQAQPASVSLWGPESVMRQVSRVISIIDVEQVTNENKIISTYKILDAEGNYITDNVNIRTNVASVVLFP